MNKSDLKEKAIELRRKGFTYSEILKVVPVAKSTISLWLREVGLSVPQKQRITEKRIAARLRAVEVIVNNKIERIRYIKDNARLDVPKLVKDPFWLTGVILYWGEGSKERNTPSSVQISNMDLNIHKIFIAWARKYLEILDDQLSYALYIHPTGNVELAKKYWSTGLNFDTERLKIYYKRHNPKTKRTNVGINYYGVLKVTVLKSIPLNRKIAGWIEGVVLYLNPMM